MKKGKDISTTVVLAPGVPDPTIAASVKTAVKSRRIGTY